MILDSYLADSKKPLPADRVAQRTRVLNALTTDLDDRGGIERASTEWDLGDVERERLDRWAMEDRATRAAASTFAARAEALLPGYDGVLVGEALTNGCYVFLTEDRGVLRHARTLFGWGLAALRPGELLDHLSDASELDHSGHGYLLVPDLLPLARFYAITDS